MGTRQSGQTMGSFTVGPRKGHTNPMVGRTSISGHVDMLLFFFLVTFHNSMLHSYLTSALPGAVG